MYLFLFYVPLVLSFSFPFPHLLIPPQLSKHSKNEFSWLQVTYLGKKIVNRLHLARSTVLEQPFTSQAFRIFRAFYKYVYVRIYLSIHMCMCVCVCMYIYTWCRTIISDRPFDRSRHIEWVSYRHRDSIDILPRTLDEFSRCPTRPFFTTRFATDTLVPLTNSSRYGGIRTN